MSVLLLGYAPVRFSRRTSSARRSRQKRNAWVPGQKLVCCWCTAGKPGFGSQGKTFTQGCHSQSEKFGTSQLSGSSRWGGLRASARKQKLFEEQSDLAPFNGIDKYFVEMEVGEEDEEEIDLDRGTKRGQKKRGRKRGHKVDEKLKKKIRLALKGKNTYKRSQDHKAKIGAAMKASWEKRKASGKRARMTSVKCGLCGQIGHNRRTCPKAEDNQVVKQTIRLCGYCQKPGHNKSNCPEMAKDMERLQRERLLARQKEAKLEQQLVSSVNDSTSGRTIVTDIRGPIPVPVRSEDVWEQALGATVRAWKAGVKRQRLEVMLPMLKVNSDMDPSMGWPGGIKQQLKVAAPLAETILKGLKAQKGLGGMLKPKILNDVDVVAYWRSTKMAAILFPQPDSMDTLLALGTKSRAEAPELMLMINPQWQPGQVISDFGFGVLRQIREDFVATFEDVFYMKRISVFSDVVLVLRSYPLDWQVHFVHPSGDMEMIGMTPSRPSFVEIQRMLKDTPGATTRLNWIDKLQQQYSPLPSMESNIPPKPSAQLGKRGLVDQASLESFGRQDLPPDGFIPDSKELDMWGESMNSVDVSRTVARNTETLQVFEEVGDRYDIVTGMPVRDLMRDPVAQFRSFFDVFGGEEDKSDGDE